MSQGFNKNNNVPLINLVLNDKVTMIFKNPYTPTTLVRHYPWSAEFYNVVTITKNH